MTRAFSRELRQIAKAFGVDIPSSLMIYNANTHVILMDVARVCGLITGGPALTKFSMIKQYAVLLVRWHRIKPLVVGHAEGCLPLLNLICQHGRCSYEVLSAIHERDLAYNIFILAARSVLHSPHMDQAAENMLNDQLEDYHGACAHLASCLGIPICLGV